MNRDLSPTEETALTPHDRELVALRAEVKRLRHRLEEAELDTDRTLVRVTRLARIVTALGQAETDPHGPTRVAAEVAELFSADIGLLLLGPDDELEVAERWGVTRDQLPDEVGRAPDAARELAHAATVLAGPISTTPVLPNLEDLGVQHVAWVRLVNEGRAQGFLLLGRRQDRPFTPFDIHELRAVGGRVAITVDNLRLQARTAAQLEALRDLHALSTQLAGTVQLSAASRLVIDLLRKEAPESTVGLYRPSVDGWAQVLAIGPSLLPHRVPDEPPTGRGVDEGAQRVVVQDAGRRVGLLLLRDARTDAAFGRLVAHVADLTGLAIGRILLHESTTHQANHDALTELPNRTMLTERLSTLLTTGRPLAVVLCDLDRFKLVNDTFGHDLGDRLLVQVADRLRGAVRPTDIVARFGGDEFVLVCHDIRDREEAVGVAQRVRTALQTPFVVDGRTVSISTSQGVVLSCDDATSDTLLRDADTAMYTAKERGKDRYELFDDALRVQVQSRVATEQAVRSALRYGRLRTAYQPLVGVESGLVEAVEALLRYQDDDGRLVTAADFIDVAEESDLILELGAWVLESVVGQLASWRDRLGDDAPPRILINVSGRQILEGGFADQVRSALARHGLPGEAIALELTESVMIGAGDAALATLGDLRAQGIQIGIDDFGTGWSSLTYLKRFPVDFVKIDREFVDGMLGDQGDASIVDAIVRLGEALGLRTVAEGVETLEHVRALDELGCDLVQGYGIGRPILAEQLEAMLVGSGRRIALAAEPVATGGTVSR